MGFIDNLMNAVKANQQSTPNNQSQSKGSAQGGSLGRQIAYGGSNGVEVPVHQPASEPVYYGSNSSNSSSPAKSESKDSKKKESDNKGFLKAAKAVSPLVSPLASATLNDPSSVPMAAAGPVFMAAVKNAPNVSWDNSGDMITPVIENAGNLETAGYEADPNAIMNSEALANPQIAPNEKGKKGNGEKSAGDELSDQFSLTKNWSPTTQMQQYYNWLETPEGQAFIEKYGDQYTQDNQGYTNLRASGNRDMWTDVMGFGDNAGIEGWKDLYSNSGVDLSDEKAMDNMMEYLYGANAIDLGNSLSTEGLLNQRVGQALDAYDEATLWYAMNNPGILEGLNAAAGIREDEDQLDANDFAYLALASRLGNMGYGNNFMDELNRAAQAAGQEQQFGFTDEGQLGYLGDDNTFLAPSEGLYDRPVQGGYNLASDNMVLYPAQGLPDSRMLDTIMYIYNNGMLQPNQEFDESEVAKWLGSRSTQER